MRLSCLSVDVVDLIVGKISIQCFQAAFQDNQRKLHKRDKACRDEYAMITMLVIEMKHGRIIKIKAEINLRYCISQTIRRAGEEAACPIVMYDASINAHLC